MRQTNLGEFFNIHSNTTPTPQKRKKIGKVTPKSPAKALAFLKMQRSAFHAKCKLNFSQTTREDNLNQVEKRTKMEIVSTEDTEFLNSHDFIEDELPASQDISPQEYDLAAIYADRKFTPEYGTFITCFSNEIKSLTFSTNKHAERLLTAIQGVFSNEMNCIYFNKLELGLIKKILTMSDDAQVLLARLIKWKAAWFRIKKISDQIEMFIADEVIREVTDNNLFDADYFKEEIAILLELLPIDELKEVSKKMKVPHTSTKAKMIIELLKIDNKKKSMFIGMKTPSEALNKIICETIGPCLRVSQTCWDLIKRIFTLLYPIQESDESFSDVFRMLNEVFYENRIYVELPKERYPIFKNRQHVMDYTKAKNALYSITDSLAKKQWDKAREIGHEAFQHLDRVFNSPTSKSKCQLPSHICRFTPSYVWTKVLWSSIDAFKKDHGEGIKFATKFLRTLLDNKDKVQGRFGRWYSELALIEMSHNKDLEASVLLTEKALTQEILSQADTAEMLERARKLASRKTGISLESRARMKQLIDCHEESNMLARSSSGLSAQEVIIEATMMQHGIASGSKSVWRLDVGDDHEYMAVEMVAMTHYRNDRFTRGIHCEGSLPVTLFACLFWDEIYTIPVPGAFVCPYQTAPLDLYGSQFLFNRQEQIEDKLGLINQLDIDALCDMMHFNFITNREYMCLISENLVEASEDFKGIIKCLGKQAVVGICRLMADNYSQWTAGFPDLIVWHPSRITCKVVEVKGPGDTLSVKQKLWIKHLLELGVETEVCYVKSKHC